MTTESHKHLVVGLVESGEHVHLYRTSATFKAQIEMLARLLPAWVDGLAASAIESDEQLRQQIEAMKNMPSPILNYPPDQLKDILGIK